MSGIWYATAIAATTGAIFSVVNEIGPLSSLEFAGPHETRSISSRQPASQRADKAAVSAYEQAMALANQAVGAYQSAKQTTDPSAQLTFTKSERDLWRAATHQLSTIPDDAASYQQAAKRRSHYQTLLATAESKIVASENAALVTIVTNSGVALENAHITLCQIDLPTEQLDAENCRQHQGESYLASAASLIKLPIAIALMDKIEREGKSLTDKIYIDPNNFTENAEGIGIEVGQEYTLSDVMTRMINESNNIATNQLIDYIGREDIAKTMAERGYAHTLIDFKLAGDRILPPNPGTQRNQATSNDLTAMMAGIYGLENPGDEALLTALISQRDRELGHAALKELGPTVQWIGEKTGQNDRLIGSTLAMKVGEQRYALTVAIDHSGDAYALRDIIHGIAKYLVEKGPIIAEPSA